MKVIDAFGKQCPLPLVMAKKVIDDGCRDLAVQVDNETAVKNLSRLGDKTGLAVSVDAIEGGCRVLRAVRARVRAWVPAPSRLAKGLRALRVPARLLLSRGPSACPWPPRRMATSRPPRALPAQAAAMRCS